jgi:small subunit ribosomal protein S7
MPRKREIKKREILPDPKYHDTMMAKFINGIMRRGKKAWENGFFIALWILLKIRPIPTPLKFLTRP